MKIAVLVALAAPLASAQTACDVKMKSFTDDQCTTERKDDKGEEGADKFSMNFTGGCEKFDIEKHTLYSNMAKMSYTNLPTNFKTTCDGTQITTQFYNDDKCETENADLKKTMKWGDCNFVEVGRDKVKNYFSVAGAIAMKAAAASVLALAASQF